MNIYIITSDNRIEESISKTLSRILRHEVRNSLTDPPVLDSNYTAYTIHS